MSSRRSQITRRAWLLAGVALAVGRAHAASKLRVGLQRSSLLLVLLRQRGVLAEQVEWAEFPAGPQLLEALAVGGVDFGMTGDAPPVFAQAAGKELFYVGAEPPKPHSSAILVPPDSPLHSLAQLRGRKIALQKGSSAHYLVARALTKASLRWRDVTPVYLTPADARAAFQRGDVDAWAIWDPYYAAAEAALPTRVLSDGASLSGNPAFYLASPALVKRPQAVRQLLAALEECEAWLQAHQDEAARLYAAQSGLALDTVQRMFARRGRVTVRPLDAAMIAEQQRVADTFLELGLIPSRLKIAERVGH
ncbi:MAG: aliphatic sulfonate ABC transporter substrate-binding protein [Polyangiales bacterium]